MTRSILRSDPTLSASLRLLPRAFWVLCIGAFINRLGTFVFPFLTIYLTASGFGPRQAKYALLAHGVGHLLAGLVGGGLADRFGRRNTIALSMYAAATSMICLSAAETLAQIMVFAFLTGLTISTYHPAAGALMGDLVPPHQRVRANTVLRIAVNAGWAAGLALAGIIASYGYHWLFYGDALTCLIFGTISLLALPNGIRRKGAQARWSAAIAVIKSDRAFIAMFIANFCAALVFMQVSTTFALHVTGAGFSEKFFGFLLASNGVLIVLLELPISNVTSKLPPRPVMAIGYALVCGGYALNVLGNGTSILIAVMLVLTLGEMIALPVAGARILTLAPESMRGRYMGAFGLSWGLATTVAPLGMDIYASSPELLWLGCGICGLIAASAIMIGTRHPAALDSAQGAPSP